MDSLMWKYVSPLKKKFEVKMLEIQYCYQLPEDLKSCIMEYNAGVPSRSSFDMGENKGMVFGGLLSFNEGDEDSIYDYIGLFEIEPRKKLKMFPFGVDPAGNFLCVKEGKIVFYDHETDRTIPVCDTFTQFLSMLY